MRFVLQTVLFCQMAPQADHTLNSLSLTLTLTIIFICLDKFSNDFDMFEWKSWKSWANRVPESIFDFIQAHHSHFVCSATFPFPLSLNPLFSHLGIPLPFAACIKHLPSFSFIWIEKLFATICYASLENKQQKKSKKKNHNETWCSKFVECLPCNSSLHFAFVVPFLHFLGFWAFLFVINFVAAVKCNCICSHASEPP